MLKHKFPSIFALQLPISQIINVFYFSIGYVYGEFEILEKKIFKNQKLKISENR